MKSFFLIAAPCVLFSVLSLAPAFSQSTTVWEIGKFDQSFREFKAGPTDRVVYQAGKSDWAQDWPSQRNNQTER